MMISVVWTFSSWCRNGVRGLSTHWCRWIGFYLVDDRKRDGVMHLKTYSWDSFEIIVVSIEEQEALCSYSVTEEAVRQAPPESKKQKSNGKVCFDWRKRKNIWWGQYAITVHYLGLGRSHCYICAIRENRCEVTACFDCWWKGLLCRSSSDTKLELAHTRVDAENARSDFWKWWGAEMIGSFVNMRMQVYSVAKHALHKWIKRCRNPSVDLGCCKQQKSFLTGGGGGVELCGIEIWLHSQHAFVNLYAKGEIGEEDDAVKDHLALLAKIYVWKAGVVTWMTHKKHFVHVFQSLIKLFMK